MMVMAAGLIAYAAFWAALRLMGQGRIRSASYAVAPAVVAGILNISELEALELPLAVLFGVASVVFLWKISGKKLVPAMIASLLGLSICLTGQLMIASFALTDRYLLLPGIILYAISTILWKNGSSIFQEDFVLTRDQKKSVRGIFTSLFPGPVVLFCWGVFILTDEDLQIFPLLIFQIIFLLLVCLMLKRLVAEMQEHLEKMMDRQYQKELLGFMRLIRSQRHDFNFHMQTVYGMIAKEQYETCRDYISSMLSIVQSSNDVLPLANPAISALLNTFQEMALQKGLKLDVAIYDNLSRIPCTVYEINTILGNLIQNAIDELEAHTEGSRIIQLLIIKRGGNNMIKVSNYCHLSAEEMKEIFHPGFTTKPSHEGLGLANAVRMAEKYNGAVYPEFEGDTIHMIAKIPMKPEI